MAMLEELEAAEDAAVWLQPVRRPPAAPRTCLTRTCLPTSWLMRRGRPSCVRLRYLSVNVHNSMGTRVPAIRESIVIKRKPADVYSYVTDVTNQPSWEKLVISVTPDDGQPVVHNGSRLTYRMRAPGGLPYNSTSVISDLVDGERGTYTTVSKLGNFRGSYIAAQHADGTEFTHEIDVAPGTNPIMAATARAMIPLIRRDVRTGLEGLRRNLET